MPRTGAEPAQFGPGTWLCRACEDELPRIDSAVCAVCGEPYDGALSHAFRCWNCQDREFDFEFAVSGYRARGLLRDLIHAFKYENRYETRGLLASLLRRALQDPRLAGEDLADWLLVPVPLHPLREMARGYNQCWEIALELSRATGIPAAQALRRTRRTHSQAGLGRASRLRNLRGAFALRPSQNVAGKCVLLIDDVLTTGSTCQEGARALRREGGAEKVVVITVARG